MCTFPNLFTVLDVFVQEIQLRRRRFQVVPT